jgi:carboxylate-amine ligase
VRPHQSFGTVEVRACDALPDIAQSIALAALQTALAARAARLYDAGELPTPDRPSDIEENLWRALRWGTDRGQIDLERRVVVSAADHARALLDACAPEIDALRLGPWLEPLGGLLQHGDHASRWKTRIEAGEDMSAIHAEQVEITMASARRLKEVLDGR